LVAVLLRLWLLVLLVCVSAFAPSRAEARAAENRTWVFAPQTVETRLEAEPQAAGMHQENGLWNYEHAPGCAQAAESAATRTTLYRAVSPGEFADAVGNQVLRPGPNSYATGKFFAENAADAAKWGKALEGPGNFRIIQVEFESGAASQFMRWQRLDGIGPARFGTFEQMAPLKISPLGTP
jgi:hypothetical protein